MYNKVVLVGNLTRDITLNYSKSGTGIANTGIATSRKYTSNGEKKEDVMFIDITFFGRSSEIANQYLRKGSKILVEGRLDLNQWVDTNSGQKRSKHSIVVETMQMLDSKNDAQNSGNQQNQGYEQGGNQGYNAPQQQQQGGYNAPAQNNSYNTPSQNQGYNAPAPQQQQQSQYAQQQNAQPAHQMPTNEIPSIDIDEDEIPF